MNLPTFAWPKLVRLTHVSPLGIYGGYIEPERYRWLQSLELQFEWVENSGGVRASGAGKRFAEHVKNNQFGAVILLNHLIGHDEGAFITAACRSGDILYGMGKKGGVGNFRAVFEEFEERLKDEQLLDNRKRFRQGRGN